MLSVRSVGQLLDHQAQMRQGGVPALSVLVGGPDEVHFAWREWGGRGCPALEGVEFGDGESFCAAWLRVLFGTHGPRAWAARVLAVRAGVPVEELRVRLEAVSQGPLSLLLERAFPGRGHEAPARLCAFAVAADDHNPSIRELMNEMGGWMECVRVSAALTAETGPLPPVLFIADSTCAESVVRIMETAALLAETCPALHVTVGVADTPLKAYLEDGRESRAKALCREGILRLRTPSATDANANADVETAQPPAIRPPAVVENAAPRTVPPRNDRTRDEDDAARSAAERFLFTHLESLPAMKGLFERNGLLDVPWPPPHVMEIDLLSREHRVAVEIDGYYHFQDPEAYRADRRRDFVLQRMGFFIVRVLADDVVARIEDIVAAIRTALSHQQARAR